ncbi:spermidine synthase-like protein [Solimonas sp. K1W22B-7]|uniref:spermine/spermidine synthase domain-containing protein n=1 Tax=Solimonas sp. K1W22B-7 TaxID=2303331 RepID=UPI000E32E814|nr:spermidine synthase-like protein [Solimonas sp. K1W22B-7]AXQ28929.1 spermidine synthase-like protein [Solimonas sp. K1W22B-7]
MSKALEWYEIPARFLSEKGVIRLREPPGADIPDLRRRLRDDEYGKPFLFDDGASRRLHFNLRYVQSQIDLQSPDRLAFAYTRKMMGFLLLLPQPRHVVIVGLGGGSLTRYCHRHLPQTQLTTLEIDEEVIAFGEWFQLPPQDSRMRIVHADAVEWFARTQERADVVLIDGCDHNGTVGALCEEAFYRNLQSRLQRDAIVVVNLLGPATRVNELQQMLGEVFGAVMSVEVRGLGNRVVFACNAPQQAPDWLAIRERAERLSREHELDLPALSRQLQYSYRDRRPRQR